MEKMWAGRFQKALDKTADDFNSSIHFDLRMFRQDITGSMAHASMLGAKNIISKEDSELIIDELGKILTDLESGALDFDLNCEDIHMFIEAELTKRIGDVGKRLHTARSRNDQVALDIRMYLRDETNEIISLIKNLLGVLRDKAAENVKTIMPGYTHLQRAQPISLGHHLMAYAMMFVRDIDRLRDAVDRMNVLPLGSCALAGTTYDTDRKMVANKLGFKDVCKNSLDGVSDRDFCIELLSAYATIMMHLSRFSEEIILWASHEFKFIELDDSFTTGSSIMPQKKNPDIAELVRGKTGRVYGALMSLLTTMKGLPLAYNKDMQEDKELTFDAIDTVKGCIALFEGMLKTMKFNGEIMARSAMNGFTNATDAADYLVKKGVPFRDAHGIIGTIVLKCIEDKKSIEDLTIDELKTICPVFEEDIYDAISLKTCVEKRLTTGAPASEKMKEVIKASHDYLDNDWIK